METCFEDLKGAGDELRADRILSPTEKGAELELCPGGIQENVRSVGRGRSALRDFHDVRRGVETPVKGQVLEGSCVQGTRDVHGSS